MKRNASVMWANSPLRFWLSLIPFATGWMGENDFAPAPTALYGAVLPMFAVAYWLLQRTIIGGWQSRLAPSRLPPAPAACNRRRRATIFFSSLRKVRHAEHPHFPYRSASRRDHLYL